MNNIVTVSSPGRVCLFGEHQDYLGLPVIAAAVNLRARFTAVPNDSGLLDIFKPDTGGRETLSPAAPLEYRSKRDYLRSGVNVMLREGCRFDRGYDVTLSSDIPIGKGCSSSSAILTAWISLLSRIAAEGPAPPSPARAAYLAYTAEVLEFGEPGGMMDHYTSALGGVQFIKTQGKFDTLKLMDSMPGAFVLGDSLEPKDTTGVLGSVRSRAEKGMSIIREKIPDADWHTIGGAAAKQAVRDAPEDIVKAVGANLANRDITRDFIRMYESGNIDSETAGALLTEHHEYLKGYLGISTPRIDAMVLAALEAGAWGAKINGSGGGGCMFAYTPAENAGKVACAIDAAGGKAIHIEIGKGLSEE